MNPMPETAAGSAHRFTAKEGGAARKSAGRSAGTMNPGLPCWSGWRNHRVVGRLNNMGFEQEFKVDIAAAKKAGAVLTAFMRWVPTDVEPDVADKLLGIGRFHTAG